MEEEEKEETEKKRKPKEHEKEKMTQGVGGSGARSAPKGILTKTVGPGKIGKIDFSLLDGDVKLWSWLTRPLITFRSEGETWRILDGRRNGENIWIEQGEK